MKLDNPSNLSPQDQKLICLLVDQGIATIDAGMKDGAMLFKQSKNNERAIARQRLRISAIGEGAFIDQLESIESLERRNLKILNDWIRIKGILIRLKEKLND